MDTPLPPNFRQLFSGVPIDELDTGPVTVIRKGSASVPDAVEKQGPTNGEPVIPDRLQYLDYNF